VRSLHKGSDEVHAADSIARTVHGGEDAFVVRGGISTPESLLKGSGVTVESGGRLNGVSVNSAPGRSIEELSKGLPHAKIGVTTQASIERAGGRVVKAPSASNPYHCVVCGVSAKKLSKLLKVIKKP
jgi:hypothetical protein